MIKYIIASSSFIAFIVGIACLERRDDSRRKEIRREQDESSEPATNHQEHTQRDALQDIARAIERLESRYSTDSPKDSRRQNAIAVASCLTFLVAAVYTVFAALQWASMSGQLAEMRTASAIQKAELAPRVTHKFVPGRDPKGWTFTVQWVNTGKTDATHFTGWKDFQIFGSDPAEVADFKSFDFLSRRRIDGRDAAPQTIIPEGGVTEQTDFITDQEALTLAAGKGIAISWGYAEYTDVFGQSYVELFCVALSFRKTEVQVEMDLPHTLHKACNTREQHQTSPSYSAP